MDAREPSASHRVDCVGVLWQAFPGDHRLDHREWWPISPVRAPPVSPDRADRHQRPQRGRQAAAQTTISLESTGSTYFHCRGLKPAASISFIMSLKGTWNRLRLSRA